MRVSILSSGDIIFTWALSLIVAVHTCIAASLNGGLHARDPILNNIVISLVISSATILFLRVSIFSLTRRCEVGKPPNEHYTFKPYIMAVLASYGLSCSTLQFISVNHDLGDAFAFLYAMFVFIHGVYYYVVLIRDAYGYNKYYILHDVIYTISILTLSIVPLASF